MYESFDRNEYFVCYADSGEGKSSIIEAGLIPKMKANCNFPIRVVFKSDEQHFKNGSIDFDDVICRIIDDEIGKFSDNKNIVVNKIYPNRLTNGDSTELHEWEKELIENNAWLKLRYTRITIDNLLYIPVLIFDQFEEVFTNPLSQEWTDCFFAWLQELSTDLCPQKIITEIEKHTDEDDFPEISTRKYFKAIFSLRSEYVGKLDYWGMQRHYIPLLKSNRYLLRPLTIKGAKEVITGQEGYNGLNDVADDIVDMLRKLQKGKNYVESGTSNLPCIPALLLSIVCSRAFNMSTEERSEFIRGLVANNDDEKEYAINALIAGFYEKAISECEIPSGDMAVIEDVLVNSEGNRQRVSSHADALKSIDFSGKYLKKLEKARLIRVIPEYNRDEDYVEIVHDCLCPIIAKRREIRLVEEAKEREERLIREQRKKGILWLVVGLFVLLIVTGVAVVMYQQKQEVLKSNKIMLENRNRFLAEKAISLADDGFTQKAILLLLSALEKGPYVEEIESSIRRILLTKTTIKGHLNDVNSALYNHDGTLIVSSSSDSTIVIWNAVTAKEIFRFKGHKGEVRYAAFSNDNSLIASASNDRTIRIWDVRSAQVVRILEGHDDWTNSANFSPDRKYVVSSSHDKTARVWNVEKGECVDTLIGHAEAVWYAEYSHDGKYIVTASWDKTIKVWDAKTGECLQTLYGHLDDVHSAKFSPDGKYIVSASYDKTVRVWDFVKDSCLAVLEGHTNPVISASFSHDGNLVISGSAQFLGSELSSETSDENEIKLWIWSKGKCIDNYKGHTDRVNTVVFHPSDKQILSASDDNSIIIWKNSFVVNRDSMNLDSISPKKFAISPNSDFLAFACWHSEFVLWNTKQGVVDRVNNDFCEVHATAFSPNGKSLAIASQGGALHIYDLEHKKISKMNGHRGITNSVCFSNDGKHVVSTADDGVRIWNLKTQRSQGLEGYTGEANCAVFCPSNKYIAAGFKDNRIRLWDTKSYRLLYTFVGHDSQVTSLKFTPDGQFLISASADKSIRIWDIKERKCINIILGHGKRILDLDISSDGKFIVSCSRDKTIRLWNLETGDCVRSFRGHNTEVRSVRFSPQGNLIYSLSYDGELRIWEIKSIGILPFEKLLCCFRRILNNQQLSPTEKKQYYLE